MATSNSSVIFVRPRCGSALLWRLLSTAQLTSDPTARLRAKQSIPIQTQDFVLADKSPKFYWVGVGLGSFDWKKWANHNLVCLIRDPRSHIESYRNWSKKLTEQDFIQYCYASKDSLASILETKSKQCFLPRFENLIKNHIKVCQEIITSIGLDPDIESIQKASEKNLSDSIYLKRHSSFCSIQNADNRWQSRWDETQKNIFKSILGKELIELGYENDNDW